jgi:hypothetical protein
MKMVSMGSKIRIQPYWDSIGLKTMGENSRIGLTDSLFRNELFDFWGSLLELLKYKISD